MARTPLKIIDAALIFLLILFFLTALWSMTVDGFFEASDINADHADAGAGDFFLLFRLFAAGGITAFLAVKFFLTKVWPKRLALLLFACFVWATFFWLCNGLERYAPGYSQERFDKLQNKYFYKIYNAKTCSEDYATRKDMTKNEVMSILGKPLMIGKCTQYSAEQLKGYFPDPVNYPTWKVVPLDCDTIWAYSYEPSGGFGWNRRSFTFKGNLLVQVDGMDEP
jgi:hypothetical protein